MKIYTKPRGTARFRSYELVSVTQSRPTLMLPGRRRAVTRLNGRTVLLLGDPGGLDRLLLVSSRRRHPYNQYRALNAGVFD
jgi:hypothetical protein